MKLGFTNKRYSPIGVDFGVDQLKLLQLMQTDPPQMIAAAAIDMPDEARTDSAARHAFLGKALPELLSKQKFKGRRAICSIPAFQTLVQNIEVGKSEGEGLDDLVAMQLRQRLNVEPSRMVVRNFPVAQVVRDGVNKQEVVCLAASRESVLQYIESARCAKLDVIGMYAEPLAIIAAFAHLYRRESDKQRTTCFVDIGAATTKVVITHGRNLVFAKVIHAAGDHLTHDRCAGDDSSFAQMRALRIQEASMAVEQEVSAPTPPNVEAGDGLVARSGGAAPGLKPLDNVSTPSQAGAMEPNIAPAVVLSPSLETTPRLTPAHNQADTLANLIDELQLCVRYHHRVFPDRRIDKLVFLGGESHHVNHCQQIAKALRIGAQLGDPLARLVRISQTQAPTGVDMRQPQPAWAAPFGLCQSEPNL